MLKKDPLFDLIKALNKSEKRYFTLFASRHVIGGKNNYLKLFEIIDDQKEYDEDELLRLFPKTPALKNLRLNKDYLFKLILKSMRSFNSQKNMEMQLKEMLDNIDFLFEKGFYAECEKIVEKGVYLIAKIYLTGIAE